MHTIQIIDSIVSIVAYVAMSFLVGFTFVRIRLQESALKNLTACTVKMTALVTAGFLKSQFESINEMKDQFRCLVEEERYEEAERLKGFILKAEQEAFRELEKFHKQFAGTNVDVRVDDFAKAYKKD